MMRKLLASGIIAAALAGCILAGCIREKQSPKTHLALGAPMPEFAVTGPSGSVSSTDLAGKKALIVIFRSTCGDCKRELPKIENAFKTISEAGSDVRFVAISEEPEGVVAEYWAAAGHTMPYFLDRSGSVYGRFEVSNVPTLYLFDSQGKVAFVAVETFGFGADEILAQIEKLR